jgi:hypothetical protein
LLLIDATTAPYVHKYRSVEKFLESPHREACDVDIATITGVGSSALGSAALAWDVSVAPKRPVLAIVPGYGVADVVLRALRIGRPSLRPRPPQKMRLRFHTDIGSPTASKYRSSRSKPSKDSMKTGTMDNESGIFRRKARDESRALLQAAELSFASRKNVGEDGKVKI